MDLSFDIRGYLKPHEKIQLSLNEFKENFVDPFDENSRRHEIFENYEQYIKDFKREICPEFKQYINGSFVTNRRSPGDIDLVNILDYKIAEEKYDLLKSKFMNKKALKNYKIDAYIVRIYPKEHKDYSKTVSDLLYWEHWFGNSKKNRAKKRFPKGFVELSFD